MCGIGVTIDSLGDIFLAFSDDSCDSLFHSKCLSSCSAIVCWNRYDIALKPAFRAFYQADSILKCNRVDLRENSSNESGECFSPFLSFRCLAFCEGSEKRKRRKTAFPRHQGDRIEMHRKNGSILLFWQTNIEPGVLRCNTIILPWMNVNE